MNEDAIFDDIRQKIWEKFPPETSKIGYLFTCPWCMSIWMAAFLTAVRELSPISYKILSEILASSAVAGILSERV